MIVEMRRDASKDQVDHVVERAHSFGFEVQLNLGTEKTVVAILGGDTGKVQTDVFAVLPGVEGVIRVMKPYKLASREFHPKPSKINVSGVEIGGERVVVMAGPCAVESEEQLMETARAVRDLGAAVVRGGAFKPRTSPFSFQGLEEDALTIVSYAQQTSVFAMVDAILEFKAGEAENLLQQLLQKGAAPAYLLVMLSRQVQMIVRAKELKNQGKSKIEIQNKFGLTSEFALRKILEQAGRYSLARLKAVYHKLLETDLSIKTGKYGGELALNILVAELCQRR